MGSLCDCTTTTTKSYRNIYIRLNCTNWNICTMLDGAGLCVCVCVYVLNGHFCGDTSKTAYIPYAQAMEIMDTQIFISNHFYKQSDNRFLMAFLAWATACAVAIPFFLSSFVDCARRRGCIQAIGKRKRAYFSSRITSHSCYWFSNSVWRVCVCVCACGFVRLFWSSITLFARLVGRCCSWCCRLVNATGFSFCRCFNHCSNCYRWVIICWVRNRFIVRNMQIGCRL